MEKVLKFFTVLADNERPSKEDYFLRQKYRVWLARGFLILWGLLLFAVAFYALAEDLPAAGNFTVSYAPNTITPPVKLHFTCGLYSIHEMNDIFTVNGKHVVTGKINFHSDKPTRLCWTDDAVPGKTKQGERYINSVPEIH